MSENDSNKKENPIEPQTSSITEAKVETESITKYIKIEVAQQLMEMGFSKNASEKACLFTSSNLEQAIEWIYEHQNDPDFEEEAQIVKQEEGSQSTLTPEEAKIKARELQERLRRNHQEKQKALEEEQERNRVRSIKEMAKAKQLQEEQELRLFVERQKKQKLEDELAKKKMLEQLARDKEERFGKKFDPYTQVSTSDKVYTKEENIQYYLKTIKTLYPPFRAEEVLKNCFNTLKIIFSNIVKNPNEDKYKKVKLTNPNFHERVGKINLAIKVLTELGFVEEGEFMTLKSYDEEILKSTIAFLEDELSKLN